MTAFHSKMFAGSMGEALTRVRVVLAQEGLAIEKAFEADAVLPWSSDGPGRPLRILTVRYSEIGIPANDHDPGEEVRFNITLQMADGGAEVTAVDPFEFVTDASGPDLRRQSLQASAALRAAFERL